jgi:diguanylate cyclase (GGDEF)-like protein
MPMFSNFHVLLIGSLLCLLMTLVLLSLWRTQIPGVKTWALGNLLGSAAFLLYAFGRELPPLIAFEFANAVYAAAGAAIYIGYRRFFERPTHLPWVLGSVLVVFAGIEVFHYYVDSFLGRTGIVALHQGLLVLGIGMTIERAPKAQRSRYPFLFAKGMAIIIVAGHVARMLVYSIKGGEMTALLQPSPWNLLFISLGTLVLPALTFGAVMLLHDRMLAKLEDVANHDFLTGAWTRRAFFELAEREFLRMRRSGQGMALLVIDVDHFKKINDTLGHAAGDQVLVDLVLRAETVVRDGIDSFARLGGEEFGLLLPETDVDEAVAVAERLRLLLNRPDTQLRRPVYSVSIGVAVSRPDEPMRELMRRADQALYQAKQEGRNRLVLQSA